MRVKKQKRHRKTVRFYSVCYGFREPFKVLCDGTFIHHLCTNQMTSTNDAVSNVLGAQTKVFTTRCILEELKSVGDSCFESFKAAKDLFTARCDHERRKSASACIEEIIGKTNPEHFFVATQDTELRNKFREIPGVPVIFVLKKILFLEPPSTFQRQFVRKTEEERLHMSELEHMMLQKQTKIELAAHIDRDTSDALEGLEDDVLVTKGVTNTISARRAVGVVDKAKFKRKKAKGPNPLSCKKKKTNVNPSLTSNQGNEGGDNTGRKRKRKRKRSGTGVKLAEGHS